MNCAFCNSDTDMDDNLAQGWEVYLLEQRDYYIFSSVRVPVCGSCRDSWDRYRYQAEYGAASADEASELLDDMILDNLIQLDDMGNKMDYNPADISGEDE